MEEQLPSKQYIWVQFPIGIRLYSSTNRASVCEIENMGLIPIRGTVNLHHYLSKMILFKNYIFMIYYTS